MKRPPSAGPSDFPPGVFLAARRPPPLPIAGGYRDDAGIDVTVSILGVKASVPLSVWKQLGLVCAAVFSIFVGIAGAAWLGAAVSVFGATTLLAVAAYVTWASVDRSARIEVDSTDCQLEARRWPWRRRLSFALKDVEGFSVVEMQTRTWKRASAQQFAVLAQRSDQATSIVCEGLDYKASADFVERTLEALRRRASSAAD